MEYIIISGQKKLHGEVEISGSKNSALPIIAASLLCRSKISLANVPQLLDINSMLKLIASLGVKVENEKENLIINPKKILSVEAKYNLVSKMRASFLVLGPLLSRIGKATVSLPGGCAIGTRPVDLHLYAMRMLGSNIDLEDGYVIARAPSKGLKGNKINFPKISVGATENAIMAAVLAQGETLIENSAREPEIIDLCNFLNLMGAKIEGIGSNNIQIQGVDNLKGIDYKIIPDRIETCTYIVAAAITKSKLKLTNIKSKDIFNFLSVMKKMGLDFRQEAEQLSIISENKLGPVNIKTEEYPGFPTDMQAQLMTLLCMSNGHSTIEENIFENRFMHVPELNRLGADINISGNKAIIKGNKKFIGAEVMATDLRASVSLILAGLAAKGETKINRIYHLDRGYDNIDYKLSKCGANISRGKILHDI